MHQLKRIHLYGWSGLLIAAVSVSARGEDSLNLGSRRELFVDHYLIDTLDGARLELHRPQPAEVVLRADRPWEGAFNYGHAVIQDGPMYRIYYRGFGLVDGPNGKTFGQSVMCGAESKDGIHWAKPDLGLTEVMGTRKNNVIVSAEGDSVGAYAFIVKDSPQPGVPTCLPTASTGVVCRINPSSTKLIIPLLRMVKVRMHSGRKARVVM
jgi:hypothetical protein